MKKKVPGTSGIYRCEVSAEETFETDYREMNITIEDAPMADPVIYNIQSRYAIDDELRINCTSFDYGPTSRLHWIINGQMKSDDDDEVKLYPTRWRTPSAADAAADSQFVSGATPEASTTIGLHIKRLTRQHFTSGNQLTVVCTALSMGSAHRRSSAVKAVLDEGLSSRQGPLVNPLRPSTAAPTAAGDKRRSPQTSTGGCSRLASNLVAIILTTIRLALFR